MPERENGGRGRIDRALDATWQLMARLAGWTSRLLFEWGDDGASARLQPAWALVLAVGGALLWAYILNWGKINFLYSDWAEGMGHRLAFLQDAVRTGQLPLNMPDPSALRNITDRYLAIPDTIISPQVLLLRFLDPGPFVVVNTILLYAVGAWGLWRLARRYRWSPITFSFVFLIFNFNGHITDHIVVGHIHWAGYFLLPWFVLLILDAIETIPSWSWIFKVDLLLLLLFLQGAFHLFVMALIFMGLLALARRQLFPPLVKAVFFAGLVCAVRILPPALEAGRFNSAFLSGFDSAFQLLGSTVDLKLAIPSEIFRNTPLNPLGYWELDHYVGLVGMLFVAVLGVGIWLRDQGGANRYSALILPSLAMTVLSIGRVYEPINRLGIPLLSSQRVSTRFFIFAVIFLTVLAGIHLQRLIVAGKLSNWARLGVTGGLLVLANDLWQHEKLWRVAHLPDMFNAHDVNLGLAYVANHPDPPYAAALIAGALITVLSLGFLGWMAYREARAAAECWDYPVSATVSKSSSVGPHARTISLHGLTTQSRQNAIVARRSSEQPSWLGLQ